MFPGRGGLDPKKMQAMMKQMGINQSEIEAEKVIIEKTDGSRIIISPASVTKIKMQGNISYQISGDETEEAGESFSEDDVQTVMEKTSCSEEEAKRVLEDKDGNLAEAILELSD